LRGLPIGVYAPTQLEHWPDTFGVRAHRDEAQQSGEAAGAEPPPG
jgi:hypothetical protein